MPDTIPFTDREEEIVVVQMVLDAPLALRQDEIELAPHRGAVIELDDDARVALAAISRFQSLGLFVPELELRIHRHDEQRIGANELDPVALDRRQEPQAAIQHLARTLGPGVMRVRPDGALRTAFARPSDPVGGIFDPTDIAVDAEGRILVSDELLHGIQVYDASGTPLGMIGRADPNAFVEPMDMARPSALGIDGDLLYVIDRGRGVVVYALPETASRAAH